MIVKGIALANFVQPRKSPVLQSREVESFKEYRR